MAAEKVELSILEAKHPEVKRLENTWERIRILVEEEEGEYSKFLTRLPREEQDDFEKRKEAYLLGFTNPSQELVTVPGDYILRRSVDRKADNADLQAFISKADRSGQSLNDFVRNQVSPCLAAYGTVVAVVDKPKTLASSKAQERAAGMPYVSILALNQILNFLWSEDGSLAYFRYWQSSTPSIQTAFDKPSGGEKQFVTWTKKEWFLHDEKGNQIGYLLHNFGVVPVVIQSAFTLDDRRTLGKSTFFSSSRHILMGNNLLSVANYEIEKFGRILLVDRQDWDEPYQTRKLEEGTNLPKVTSKAAETKVMPVTDMTRKPEYLTTEIEIIDKANAQAWKYFSLAADTESSGREANPLQAPKDAQGNPQSGIAKAYDFQDMNANLYAKAMDLEEFERSLLSVISTIQRSNAPFSVKYPTTFDVRGFGDKVKQIAELQRIGYKSKTGMRVAFGNLTHDLTSDEATARQIETELDQADLMAPPANPLPAEPEPEGNV